VQNSFSLLDRDAEREMFPLCADQQLGFTAFSPLAGGWLTGKYAAAGAYPDGSRMTLRPEPYRHLERDTVFRGLKTIAEEAAARGLEMAALAIAWRNPAHLAAALAATSIELSDGAAGKLQNVFG
jgi:aryl-alcohol dehydrogenase-like predicted oxidoreductase